MAKERIEAVLQDIFTPHYLEVLNESHKHTSGRGADSHFKVVVVSTHFEGKRLVPRHQMINQALQAEFDRGMHALSIQAMTPDEWAKKGGTVVKSPNCLGIGQ